MGRHAFIKVTYRNFELVESKSVFPSVSTASRAAFISFSSQIWLNSPGR